MSPDVSPSGAGMQRAAGAAPMALRLKVGESISVIPVCRNLAEPDQDRQLGSELQLPDEGALSLALTGEPLHFPHLLVLASGDLALPWRPQLPQAQDAGRKAASPPGEPRGEQ